MKSNPLVSVCIPAYNAEKTISQTIDSILGQTYTPIEIIVSDNNSTDNTLQILKQYGSDILFTRCPIQISNHNDSLEVSQSAHNNSHWALSHAKGELVTIYHADDVYDKHIIQKEVEFLISHPDCGVVFTMNRFINEQGKIIARPPIEVHPQVRNKSEYDLAELLNTMLVYGLVLPTPSVMARRNLWEKAGKFNPTCAYAADIEMWMRMAGISKIGVINEVMFSRRISRSQDSFRWYRMYRHRESPLLNVFDSYIGCQDIRPLITKKSLVALKWTRVKDCTRLALNYFADREIDGGKRYLQRAYSLKKELGPPIDRNAKMWNSILWFLLSGAIPPIQCKLASILNIIYEMRQFGGSFLWKK